NGYKGEYVVEIARALRAREGDRLMHKTLDIEADLPPDESQGTPEVPGDKEKHVDALIARARTLLGEDDYRLLLDAALAWCLADIREDLSQFGVRHDNFFSERS